ncbi:haloacid dehalogenase-like hydrolase [Candidatus Wolfebacteria bacterium]|nr:haloacid dehalogenase-like hydrolase [Candidatus Wolfebacteria bacterium]
MPKNLFLQNIIALIWDFDKTLTPGYMEEPLFRHFNVEPKKFWEEVNGLPDFYKQSGLELVSKDTLYLNHILTYVRQSIFKGLNNKLLRELGSQIEFYPGLPDFFARVKERVKSNSVYAGHEIAVENYVVSTGLRQMILGSKIVSYVDYVWGCEFIENIAPPGYLNKGGGKLEVGSEKGEIIDIGYVLDNTTKTRAIFEINKGANKLTDIDVNAAIKPEDRRIPFQNMIYVADGPSDIPVFSIVNHNSGKTFAVYNLQKPEEFRQVNELQKQGRVQSFGEANYKEGSQTFMWLTNAIEEVASRIVRDRDRAVGDKVGLPPKHLG